MTSSFRPHTVELTSIGHLRAVDLLGWFLAPEEYLRSLNFDFHWDHEDAQIPRLQVFLHKISSSLEHLGLNIMYLRHDNRAEFSITHCTKLKTLAVVMPMGWGGKSVCSLGVQERWSNLLHLLSRTPTTIRHITITVADPVLEGSLRWRNSLYDMLQYPDWEQFQRIVIKFKALEKITFQGRTDRWGDDSILPMHKRVHPLNDVWRRVIAERLPQLIAENKVDIPGA